MPRLVLVKHAMPAIEPAVPARAWPLSAQGRVDAERLAQALTAHRPTRLLSSTEPKAVQTAAVLAERLGLPSATRPDLHEHDRRGVGFLSDAGFEAAVARFFERPEELVMGAETAAQAADRFTAAVDALMEEPAGQGDRGSQRALAVDEAGEGATVVVAHGTVIALYLARRAGLDGHATWKRLGLPSYAVLDWPGGGLLALVGDLNGAAPARPRG